MNRLARALLAIGLAFATFAAPALTVVRGPYLQLATPDSIVIRWRTDVPSDSRVLFGAAPGALNNQQIDAASTTEHEVRLSGLSADTVYFYAVGSGGSTLVGNDANHRFRLPPANGTARPTRVWVIGDAGTASINQRKVRDAYQAFNGSHETSLWLMLGDNAYNSGTDSEYQAAVFDTYRDLLRSSVVWPTRGNHETLESVYYAIFTLPRHGEAGGLASGSEAFYAFNVGNIHFICLDSQGSGRSSDGVMAKWLVNDLADNTLPWVVAFWHHPPYSKGSHDSDTETQLIQMRETFLPILENGGVDLVLTGHSHAYERSFLIDGHYGRSSTFSNSMKKNGGSGRADGSGAYAKPAGAMPRQGAVYAVAGASGQASGGSLDHPAMYISLNNLGSMVLDFDANRLDVRYLRETGAVADHFTLVKGAPNQPPTVALTAPAPGSSFVAPASIGVGANASDSDGSIAKVEFFAGATPIGTDASAPYAVVWSNAPAGNHQLTARATDDRGASTTSAAVAVTIAAAAPGNVPPQVAIDSPADGAHFVAPARVTIQATASDADGSIAKVELLQSGRVLATATAPPYSFVRNDLPAGSHSYAVRATDNQGAGATVALTVVVDPPPAPSVADYPAASAYEQRRHRTYGPGSAQLAELNSAGKPSYKLKVEARSDRWWDIDFVDPAGSAGAPLGTIVTLHAVPERSWSGSFTLQYVEGDRVLAQVALPLDGTRDPATGKGQPFVQRWDLSGVVRSRATLAAGKLRLINGAGNGRSVYVTYCAEQARF